VKEWWIGDRAYAVAEAKVHSGSVVAKLAGLETREQALALKGKEVSVQRDALPEPGEGRYYLADLVGLEVVNEQGDKLGIVKQLFTNGAQDVMEVAGDRTRLMPWVPTVVKDVDLAARRITVEWGADW
jgi:16S rRNA processing protein RimM